MNEDELVNICSSVDDRYASSNTNDSQQKHKKYQQTQFGININGFNTASTQGITTTSNTNNNGTNFNNTHQFNNGVGVPHTSNTNNPQHRGALYMKGSFLNDISIEGVDEQGRVTLKSLSGRDSSASIGNNSSSNGGGSLKWKRKSELRNSMLSSNKSRISIKGNNQYEYILRDNDPFNYGRASNIYLNDQQKAQGAPSQMINTNHRNSRKLGNNTGERMSRISQIIQQQQQQYGYTQIQPRNSIGQQPAYQDFIPENDEGDIGDEMDMDDRKFSIRALNFNMMSRLSPQHTLLARASSKILSSSFRGHRNSNQNRGTLSARKNTNGQLRKNSRLSKAGGFGMGQGALTSGRDSELLYNLDDGSIDEETDFLSSHRCSIVKRYNIPTFFTPDKSLSNRQHFGGAQPPSSSGLGSRQGSPYTDMMQDSINVHQPASGNVLFSGGNETIIEETNENEADESIMQNQNMRFSQQFQSNANNKLDFNDYDDNNDQNLLGRVSQGLNNNKQQNTIISSQNDYEQQINTVINNKHQQLQDDYDLHINDYQLEQQQITQQQQQQTQQKPKQKNKLDAFVTKVPMPGSVQQQPVTTLQKQESNNSDVFDLNKQSSYVSDQAAQQQFLNDMQTVMRQDSSQQQDDNNQNDGNDENGNGQDLHKVHFFQTLQALQFIKNNLRVVEFEEIQDQVIYLPDPKRPELKKVLIFDMDETLIHCVDDVETDDPDVVLEIDFPDEETVYAGINIRPYVMECLEEANQHFQVIVFTASHQTYADAILDYLDPNHELIQYRMYRQHCILTKEGYYVKDLRVIGNRDLNDLVIVDNSVYSFAFQIDNGIPIIPFYKDPNDEEMLHLIYYLNCLANVEDVRQQNRAAFELYKLANGDQQQNQQSQDDEEQALQLQQQQQMYSDDYINGNNDVDLIQNSHHNSSNGIIMEMSRESSLNNNSNIMYQESRPSAGKYYLDQNGRDSYNLNNNNAYNDYDNEMLPQKYQVIPEKYNFSPKEEMSRQVSQNDSLYNEDIQNIDYRFNNL